VDMRVLLVDLFMLSRPTNAEDVLKFAFCVSFCLLKLCTILAKCH